MHDIMLLTKRINSEFLASHV